MDTRRIALEIFNYALKSALPENMIKDSIKLENDNLIIKTEKYNLKKFNNIYVFGSGKASIKMAKSIEGILGDRIKGGLIVSNYYDNSLEKIKIFESSHPVPTEKSIKASGLLMKNLSGLNKNDLFIFLLSGGSSALIEKPLPPLTLKDFQKTTKLLLNRSVPIEEINVIRKHLSMIKGGRLGRFTKARGIVLVISDVIGDDLETIGSAPLYCDSSSYRDAYDILSRYDLWNNIPENIKIIIEKGLKGGIEETPKKPNPKIKHFIIGNNFKGLKKAKEKSEELGIKAHIMSSQLKGEAKEVAKAIISIGKEIQRVANPRVVNPKSKNPFRYPVCLLFGGETTVTVTGTGKGGRNQEMCLSALREIRNSKNILFLSGGTDGIDGNSDAAGAVVDYRSFKRAKKLNLSIDEYLKNNDSYNFLKQTKDLIITGSTGTNVMDITILLLS